MKRHATGTLLDRTIQLDKPVDLPAHSRVNVEIAPLEADPDKSIAAWEALCKRLQARPIHSGGRHFTRDELHERG